MDVKKVAIGLGVAALVLFGLWQNEHKRAQCFAEAYALTAGFYPPSTVASMSDSCKAVIQAEFF